MRRANRLGSPEGTRGQLAARRTIRSGSLAAIVLLSACIAVAIGDETASLTVSNATPHQVVVVVAERTYPNVAPGADAVYRASGAATVRVNVSYVSGQGVEGSAQRSFHLTPDHGAVSSGTTVYWACTTSGSITAPAGGGHLTWKVTADTLASR